MDDVICRCGHPARLHAGTNGQCHAGSGTGGTCPCVLSKSQARNHEMWHFARIRELKKYTDEHLRLELQRRARQDDGERNFLYQVGDEVVFSGLIEHPELNGLGATISALRPTYKDERCPSGCAYYLKNGIPWPGTDYVYQERLAFGVTPSAPALDVAIELDLEIR